MTQALDAAVDAIVHHLGLSYEVMAITCARAALCAALPEEPPEWFKQWNGNYGARVDGYGYAWRALRAQILGKE